MTAQIYACCDEKRKERLRQQAALVPPLAHPINGIDYVEVTGQQLLLNVHIVLPLPPAGLAILPINVRIDGGERVRGVQAVRTQFVDSGQVLEITVNGPGDASPYTLRLVNLDGSPLAGLDEVLAQITFSFKVECPSPFDCRSDVACTEPPDPPVHLDYLAKDYASFNRIMLDRMSLLLPQWKERHAADLGITLVELLAYAADQLSYEQDAVATEAYLGTARRRTSVRRHARLVDYRMHDGCNARVFVQVHVAAGDPLLPAHTQLFTQVEKTANVLATTATQAIAEALQQSPEIFETMADTQLHAANNSMGFHTWSDDECCLPCGATSATLAGHHPLLVPGDLVILKEVKGPRTGAPADADPSHQHCVRLTAVNAGTDTSPRLDALETALQGKQIAITEIAWGDDDALPFPLCISARLDETHSKKSPDPVTHDVSIVLGNIVIADHGSSVRDEQIGQVPKATLFRAPSPGSHCDPQERVAIPPRFRPRLKYGPLTEAAPLFDKDASAASAMRWRMEEVLPSVYLTSPETWEVRESLLESDSDALEFVADVEEDGLATIRFGDDTYGQRPAPCAKFLATYRIGNGTSGNVGARAIAHIVTDANVDCVSNPMPARGGVDPEPLENVRHAAPAAFRAQERAVTEADYASVCERMPGVDHAAATFRWTGSWYTVFNTVDRSGGLPVDDAFRGDARAFIDRFRVIGNDLDVDTPRFVPLEIAMRVCVESGHFRADVESALLARFRDLFDPDRFTFGQPVYLSMIYEAARGVDGVDGVAIDVFRRRGVPTSDGLGPARLDFDRLEIAQLANSRDFPERGVLDLKMEGGR